MPTLWKRLRLSSGLLLVGTVLVAVVSLDASRDPGRQLTARAYIGGVRLYQAAISPVLRPYVRCRYKPSCSEYSRQAVEKYGIARGIVLTVKRVSSCTGKVPLGTSDPVP